MCDEERKFYPLPETIYHYTSADSFHKIITNNQLWYSRYDCLNDISEGKYVEIVYQKAIAELRGTIEQDFLNNVANIKPDFRHFKPDRVLDEKTMEGELVPAIPYICCFSINRDSLPMWNYYSKNGRYEGYNIGFKNDGVNNTNERRYRVIYNESDQIAILKNLIEVEYENMTKYGHNMASIWMMMGLSLADRAFQFKNPAFEHENEFRIVYWRFNSAEDTGEDKIFYYQREGIIIPYLIRDAHKELICEVTVGPLANGAVAKAMAEELLKNNNINNAVVSNSIVPIRY